MPANNQAFVNSNTQNGITVIEFFHPQRNSLPHYILMALSEAIENAGKDSATRVIILQSAEENLPDGKIGTFCSGASFDELMAIKNETDGLLFFSGFAMVINAMRACPKFIIGRIHGKCVGGGVGLAAAVDYAIALNGASVKLSELAVGIGPFVVGPAVERKIGNAAFSVLAIDAASWRDGTWAYQTGLYAELHNNVEQMDQAIEKLSTTLAASSPEAMAELKKVCWKGTDNWDSLLKERAAISGRLVLSDFTRNAIEAFKKK